MASTAAKQIILVTGANGGIGFELVAQLIANIGNHVLLGARSLEKGQAALKDLHSRDQPGEVDLLQLDVTSEDSIAQAVKTVDERYGRLDALVNNAATGGHLPSTLANMQNYYLVNSTGPLIVTKAFEPLLLKSKTTPRVLNVSSGAGSTTRRLDATSPTYGMKGGEGYRSSKAALNMITACQAVELGAQGVQVFAYCPGFTVSNLSAFNTAENGAKPTAEGARPMVRILRGERDADHGKFLDGEEAYYPW